MRGKLQLATVALAAVVMTSLAAAAPEARIGTIRITAERVAARPAGHGTVEQFILRNLSVSPYGIGNAHLYCIPVGAARGPAPPEARFCWGDYAVGYSSIQVSGVARRRLSFELAVTGGTGVYAAAGGSLLVIRYASRPVRERLVFQLKD